ncbi:MAG: hypothetical protein ACM3ZR_03085 [Pseudomonadota bacterium]
MEKNLSTYVSKLIELDTKAVDLKEKRDAEISKLEEDSRNELKAIDELLDKAAIEARQEHDRIIGEARQQVKEIDEAAERMQNNIRDYFTGIMETAAGEVWKQLLDIER